MRYFPAKILLATDGSEDAALALRAAVDLSVRTGSELHVVHAWQPFPEHSHPSIAIASDSALYEREAQKTIFGELDRLQAMEGEVSGAHLRRGRPVETICEVADELGAGLVVIGSRGLGPVTRLVMGSVSEGVVDLASRPVLVLRGRDTEAWPPARVVVGYDGSAGAQEAAGLAADMGKVLGAELTLVRAEPVILPLTEVSRHSRDPVSIPEDLRKHHELSLMDRAYQLQDVLGYRPRFRLIEGEPASVLLKTAEGRGGPTLLSVGRRGLGLLDRLRLGSVSTKVLRASTAPVLISPP
jgi:nucleotide-binding universal stress UspA family protein